MLTFTPQLLLPPMGFFAGPLLVGLLARGRLKLPTPVVAILVAFAVSGLWWALSIFPVAVDWAVLVLACVVAFWPRRGPSLRSRGALLVAVAMGLICATPNRRGAPLDSSLCEVYVRYQAAPHDYDHRLVGYSLITAPRSVSGFHARLAPERCEVTREADRWRWRTLVECF